MIDEQKVSYFGYSYEFINRVKELIDSDEEFAIVDVVSVEGPSSLKPGNKLIVKADGSFEGWIGGFCTKDDIIRYSLEAIKDGQAKYLNLKTCHGGIVYLYIEPVLGKKKLILVGNNPIIYYIQKLGEILGFTTVKLSDVNELRGIKITKNTFAIIATMGEKDHDFAESFLDAEIKYIGIIAGKKRGEDLLSYLRSKGYKEDSLAKIKIPAGIDIGASSPEEIALSVLAEVIKISKKRETSLKSEEVEEVIDPVCGMSISKSTPFYSTFEGKVYYFCSKYCKDKFDANPQIYTK